MTSRAGYVLVGGQSSRMGRDKALLPWNGVTLAQTIAEAVKSAAGSVSIVGNRTQESNWGQIGFVPDLYPGEGPLGGILTALQHTRADWNLVVACDMPHIDPDFLGKLLTVAEESGADALVPTGPSGRLEPLCACYHRKSGDGLRAAFAGGVRKIAVALEQVRCILWPVQEVDYFQNVNTPEEWSAYGQ